MDILGQFLPIILIVLIFVFLVIIPGQKQRKERERFINGLKAGDRVVTNQGIFGEVVSVNKGIVCLEISDKTKIRMLQEGILRLQSATEMEP